MGLLTLSNFATKMIGFFLVPLYTNILSTEEYGGYDLIHTTISLLVPMLTFNILDAVLRFSLDQKADNEKSVANIGLRYVIQGTIFVTIFIIFNYYFHFFTIFDRYPVFFVLMFFSNAFTGYIVAYARGTDHIMGLSISSVISSFITISLNILFLAYFKLGLNGFFIANIVGPMFQSAYLVYVTKLWKNISLQNSFDETRTKMVKYSAPLIANSISWWVNSSSDRYIVTLFCGVTVNGVYAVASKIPSILNIAQTIFNQAWTLSAVKDYDADDKSGFFSNTYNTYNCIMVLVCSIIICFDKVLALFLYKKDFYLGWKYAPFLVIAIVFGAMSGFLGGLLAANKDSKEFAKSTSIGAILNVLLNFVFTPIIGALGAAIATTISYMVVWFLRLRITRKTISLRINYGRDILSYLLLIIQAVTLLFVSNNVVLYIVEFSVFVILLLLYSNAIKLLITTLLSRGKGLAK